MLKIEKMIQEVEEGIKPIVVVGFGTIELKLNQELKITATSLGDPTTISMPSSVTKILYDFLKKYLEEEEKRYYEI